MSISWLLWYAGWRSGRAAADPTLPVYVSVTDFRIGHPRHALGAWRTGLRLRRSWPRLDGAIGLWLWSEPLKLRSGAISIWQSEADLIRFLRSPAHRAIMAKYRTRMHGTSTGWVADRFDRAAIWAQAAAVLRQPARCSAGSEGCWSGRGGA
jgi:hypothetical protein